jgi:hypothetical protein
MLNHLTCVLLQACNQAHFVLCVSPLVKHCSRRQSTTQPTQATCLFFCYNHSQLLLLLLPSLYVPCFTTPGKCLESELPAAPANTAGWIQGCLNTPAGQTCTAPCNTTSAGPGWSITCGASLDWGAAAPIGGAGCTPVCCCCFDVRIPLVALLF